MANNVITGALALIRVKGKIVGKMKSVQYSEQIQRADVMGLGTIFVEESPVTKFTATLSCSHYFIDMKKSGIPGAMKRDLPNIKSQVLSGQPSVEDNLVLDPSGVQIDIFAKVSDVVNPDGSIKPKLEPIAIIPNCLIESNSLNISEGQAAGMDQTFKCLTMAITPTF